MLNPTTCCLLGSLLLSASLVMAQDNTLESDPVPAAQPRQVILVIGDGMDEQQITIARNYLKGAAGQLLLDRMPLRSAVQILTTEDRENGKPVYVADSANTATSMATGAITSTGRISTSAGTDFSVWAATRSPGLTPRAMSTLAIWPARAIKSP